MSEPAEIAALGDGALLVTLGRTMDLAVNRRAHRLARIVTEARRADPRLADRIGVPVPGYVSVLVPYEPLELDQDLVRGMVDGWLAEVAGADDPPAGRLATIPVRYGAAHGIDLADVASMHGLRPADVVELHAGREYTVLLLGFAPGFAYLGELAPELATPRRATPRERVPAGSVAIAGTQTAVYPFASPGGWHLIGRTDTQLWDIGLREPALLAAGDRVRFEPVR